ncbi:hypothetical protein Dimus_039604 [Dionaea muscipula]
MQLTVMNNHPRNPITLESHNPKSRSSFLSTPGPRKNSTIPKITRQNHYIYLSLEVTTSLAERSTTNERNHQSSHLPSPVKIHVIKHHHSGNGQPKRNTKQSTSHHNKETPITTPTTEYELSSPNSKSSHKVPNNKASKHPHQNRPKESLTNKRPGSKVHNSTTSPSVKVNNHLIKARTKMATKPYQPNQKITQVQKDQSTTIAMSQVPTSHPKIN